MRLRTALCSAVSTLSALALLSACSSGSTSASAGDAPLVGVDYPRSDTDFWNSYIKYTPEYGKKLGLSLKTTNSQNDVAKLTANAQTFISQGVKGIAMAPQDTAAIAPTLAQLESKKIPVVTVDTRPDTGNVYMVVRADNRAYGEKACQYLGTKLDGKGKVVMLEGGLDSINGRDRTEAFNDCMKKNYPGIKVFGEATNWDGAVAAQKLQTDLTAHPDIKGVYMEASFALSGTLQVLKQKGLLVDPKDKKHV
ncbi:sugar ABC transporter substrate-binding protein, partial [Streptomyces mirabilis]